MEEQQQNKSTRISDASSPSKENGGRADPSPDLFHKQPADPERPIPLSPNRAKAATAPQQPPEAAASSSQPAASGAPAPRSYWPRATPHGASHKALHASLPNGVIPHDWLEAPTRQPPASLPRGDRTVACFLHYPRATPHESYGTPTGGGTDVTVCMMTKGVNQGIPPGTKAVFLEQWDYFDDLDGPRDLKVGSVPYSFRKHFWSKLTEWQQFQWWASKVRKLASVMVDEIVERGREGMDAIVAGDCPLEFWPELLEDAAAIARKETGRPYEIAFPPNLPPLQPLNEGEDAPEVGEYELQHPSGAAPSRFMSLCHRKRLDAALSWVHRVKLDGATITYFQSLSSKYGDKSEAEIKELRRDASARYGGYHGPWPYESELTTEQWAAQYPEQWAALNAAVSTAKSLQKRGGKELVEKAEAGDEAAAAASKRKASAGSAAKLEKISKNSKQRAIGLKATKTAKQNASTVVANFSLAKLRADMKLGGSKQKKGARNYPVRELVSLRVAKGGTAKILAIQALQQEVLKLYS